MEKRLRARKSRKTELPSTRDFQFIGGSIALDFVNTMGNRLGEKRDYFQSTGDVNRWARLAGLISESESLRLNAEQMRRVRTVREELYGIFKPLAARPRPTQQEVARLNAMIGSISLNRRLRWAKGKVSWESKVLVRDPMSMLTPILLNAAEVLVSGAFQKVRQCGDESCGWLFLDASQAGKRRWCSMADCGNRAKARRHYQRAAI